MELSIQHVENWQRSNIFWGPFGMVLFIQGRTEQEGLLFSVILKFSKRISPNLWQFIDRQKVKNARLQLSRSRPSWRREVWFWNVWTLMRILLGLLPFKFFLAFIREMCFHSVSASTAIKYRAFVLSNRFADPHILCHAKHSFTGYMKWVAARERQLLQGKAYSF